MREIKFRAKIKHDAGVYRVLAINWHKEEILVERASGDEWLPLRKIQRMMQFAGMHDKDGKEIYEGDVVNYPFKNFNGEIEFHDGGFCITHNAVCRHELSKAASLSIKVIGNIYENSDLLEKKL